MKNTSIELMPGVLLNHTQTDKFKSSFITVSLLSQLSRETASMNALIPFVLRRGTTGYENMEKISNRCDELYGTVIEPIVRCAGEIHCTGFVSSFPEDCFLPEGESIIRDAINLICDMLLHPVTRGGLFLPSYVESERDKLCDMIASRINDKRSYSVLRCIEEMCCYEDFSVGSFGSEEDCRSINYKKLTKHYHQLLQTSPIVITYCGRQSAEKIADCFHDALCTLPRGEIDYDLGTDIRMNSIEAQPRIYEEKLDVTQGKLVIGFRLGEYMEKPDRAVLKVFNTVYGGGVTSKLFENVREKLQLCYYAGSSYNFYKGILYVSSGIDFDKYEEAKNEILFQLDEVRKGNVTADELEYARASCISDIRTVLDSPSDVTSFYFSSIITGDEFSPEEYIEMIEKVSLEDVVAVAKSVECDLIYFLKGDDSPESEAAEP